MRHSVKFMTFLKLPWIFQVFHDRGNPVHSNCTKNVKTSHTKGHTGWLKDTWSILNETPTHLDALVFNLLWIWLLPERLLTAYDTRIITSLSNHRTEKMARTRRTSTIILFIFFFSICILFEDTCLFQNNHIYSAYTGKCTNVDTVLETYCFGNNCGVLRLCKYAQLCICWGSACN